MTAIQVIETVSAAGIRLLVTDGKLKVDAPAGVLTAEMKAELARCKAELLALLTPRPYERCSTPMTNVEFGYHSCPGCRFQIVERHSGFWVANLSQMLKEAA